MKKLLAPIMAMAPPSTVSHDFTAIFELHQKAIERFCMHKCRNQEVSQDLTQETFMRFWQCLERKEHVQNARAFLYHIARNLFIDHVRKKKSESLDEMLEVGFEPAIDPWQQIKSRMHAETLLGKLEHDQYKMRETLFLRFDKGFGPQEIAAFNGESSNVVSVRIFRGLKALRGVAEAAA